ncbi:hypothetical protein RM96_00565 [Cupriavidus sp. IDO]|nr:hypothetical protein RM96_00565 [Cupriavidus sp. IDO]
MLRSKRDSGYAFRPGWMAGLLSLFVLIAAHGPVANGQALSQPAMADSVVSRLVAWRGRTDQPVRLATLTAFDWDSFSVTKGPAGDAMANCGRAGLLPCGPELQPPAGQPVQVLRFRRGSTQVYEERIMAENGVFAEPLPAGVPRAAATLVSCVDGQGRQLWCLQDRAQLRKPAQFLDGG